MDLNNKKKPAIQMADEKQIQFAKKRFGAAFKSSISAVIIFFILFGIYTIGKNIIDPYPDVTSINTLYSMDYPGNYVEENVGEKVYYSDIYIWDVNQEEGVAKDFFLDIYFKDKEDVEQIQPMSIITIKGTIGGLDGYRFVISDAILVDIEDSQVIQPESNFGSETQIEDINRDTSSDEDEYFDLQITGEQLIEEADANMARMIHTYSGKRLMITDLEITSVTSDRAIFDFLKYIYFRDNNDLYSINEGDKITVIGNIVEFSESYLGSYCISDAVLVDLPNETIVENNMGAGEVPSSGSLNDSDADSIVNDLSLIEGIWLQAHNASTTLTLWFDSDVNGLNGRNWKGSEPAYLNFELASYDFYEEGQAMWFPSPGENPYFEGEFYYVGGTITIEVDDYDQLIVNCPDRPELGISNAQFFGREPLF